MPAYDFTCMRCQKDFEKVLRITECQSPQSCPDCGDPATRVLTNTSFVLKGDLWPGKAIHVKGQMAKKNSRLDKKMRDRPQPKLAPNVDGERVENWKEARKLAADRGKNTASYDQLVAKEHGASK